MAASDPPTQAFSIHDRCGGTMPVMGPCPRCTPFSRDDILKAVAAMLAAPRGFRSTWNRNCRQETDAEYAERLLEAGRKALEKP